MTTDRPPSPLRVAIIGLGPKGLFALERLLDHARRSGPQALLDIDVYEVKLGEDFLMSSLFTVAEIALATLGLAEVSGSDLDVAVAAG